MLSVVEFDSPSGAAETPTCRQDPTTNTTTTPPHRQPRGQVSNIYSLHVSHSVLNRNRACHSSALTQNNRGYGWHINGPSVFGGKCGARKSDSHELDTRKVAARMSVNQRCHSVAGGVFLRRAQSVAAVFFFFLGPYFCRNRSFGRVIKQMGLSLRASPLRSTLCLPPWTKCAIWPFALSQGVKEHQINSKHWRIKPSRPLSH